MPWALPIGELELVALDLETTGVAPGFDRITEIGAVRFRVGEDGALVPGATFDRLVRPGRSVSAPVAALTGLTDELLAGAPVLEEIWSDLGEFLAPRGRPLVLVAHRAIFDVSFLVAAGERLGRPLDLPPALCTAEAARAAFPKAPRYGLASLVEWLGCGGVDERRHRALPDAVHCRNLFARCVVARGARALADLGVEAFVRRPEPRELHIEVPPRLAAIQPFMDDGRRVRIRYRGGSKGRQARPVTPLAFYRSGDALYLRAICHVDETAKSFRCDRIAEVLG